MHEGQFVIISGRLDDFSNQTPRNTPAPWKIPFILYENYQTNFITEKLSDQETLKTRWVWRGEHKYLRLLNRFRLRLRGLRQFGSAGRARRLPPTINEVQIG